MDLQHDKVRNGNNVSPIWGWLEGEERSTAHPLLVVGYRVGAIPSSKDFALWERTAGRVTSRPSHIKRLKFARITIRSLPRKFYF
jgi:hypothetical protein